MAQVLAWVSFQVDQWDTFDLEEWNVFVIHVELEIGGEMIGPDAIIDGKLYPAPNITIQSDLIGLTGRVIAKLRNNVFIGAVPEIVVDVNLSDNDVLVDLGDVVLDIVLMGMAEVLVPLPDYVTVLDGEGGVVDLLEVPVLVFEQDEVIDVPRHEIDVLVALETVTLLTDTDEVDLAEIPVLVGIPEISVDSEAGSYEYLVEAETTQ